MLRRAPRPAALSLFARSARTSGDAFGGFADLDDSEEFITARGDSLHLTQAFLGRMLGVRRVGVTEAASELQARWLIGYHRGEIVVVNRRGLEAAACGCYAGDKRLYERTFG